MAHRRPMTEEVEFDTPRKRPMRDDDDLDDSWEDDDELDKEENEDEDFDDEELDY